MVTWLAIAGLLVWVSFEFLLRRPGEARRWAGGADMGRSTTVLVVSFLLALAISLVFSVSGLALAPLAVRASGCLLLACGLALRGWSMAILGSSYRRGLLVTERQALITTGPYRVLPHPGQPAGVGRIWARRR